MTDLSEYHGYYQVKDLKIRSKIEASLTATKLKTGLKWNFNEEYFSSLDWSVEPTESIEELYKKRALELREKYDHIVIHFSAGRDSGNIMDTFIKNNILVDEIFIRGPFDHLDKSKVKFHEDYFYAEIFIAAYPIAKMIKEKYYPNVDITVHDTKVHTVNFFKENKNWFELGNSNLNPGNYYKADFDQINPNWRKLAERGKKIGHIIGVDKPRVLKIKERFYFSFIDTPTIDFCSPRMTTIDLPIYNEMFYWHPTCAKMLIKQGHLIKKFIKENEKEHVALQNRSTEYSEETKKNDDPYLYLQDRKFSWHEQISNIIYERTLPVLYSCPKSLCEVRNGYLSWFWEDTNSKYYQNWKNGLDFLFTNIDKKLLDEELCSQRKLLGTKTYKLKGCWSKSYDLGT